MSKKTEEIEAEIVEEKGVILAPFKDIALTEGVDLKELLKTYAEVPEIDPEAENAGELYQYVLKGHKAFVKARNKIETVRKQLKAPALAFGKDVDERAKALASSIIDKELELFKQRKLVEDNEQRKQDEAEARERNRTGGIRQLIISIQNMAMQGIGLKSDTLKDLIEKLEIPSEEKFEEFTEEAMGYYKTTMTQLESLYETAVKAEEADKINAEAEAKRIEAEEKLKIEMDEKADKLDKEREDFEREKREFEESKALKVAEDEAEAVEKKEDEEAEEAKKVFEEIELGKQVAKDATENEFYDAYSKGGLDGVLKALFENKYTYVKWMV